MFTKKWRDVITSLQEEKRSKSAVAVIEVGVPIPLQRLRHLGAVVGRKFCQHLVGGLGPLRLKNRLGHPAEGPIAVGAVIFKAAQPLGVFFEGAGAGVGIGYDAAKDEYVNMIEAGIVDPAKVTRSALQNAASIAAMVLTTETLVADKPAPEGAAPAAPAMGGMPGMM